MGVTEQHDNPPTQQERRKIVREWFERRIKVPGTYLYAIEDLDGKLIGDIDLQIVSQSTGMAWLTIEIGEKDYWGKGFGTDAINTLLRGAFGSLGIQQIRLNVKKSNIRAIRCYQKCGFLKESEEDDEYLMVASADNCEI